MKDIALNSGNRIPQIGLGTWKLTGDRCINAVTQALSMGYNHIDTASAYDNHAEVGRGIKESERVRDSFFLTSKIPKSRLDYDSVLEQGKQILQDLHVDYLDLLLIHWPTKSVPFSETFRALTDLRNQGYTRDIGISNFNAEIAKEAVDTSDSPVVINQVEFHPLLYQKQLLEKCSSLDIKLTAYSPLAQGRVLENRVIEEMASDYSVSKAQISIAWILSKGLVSIPRSSQQKHLKDNLKASELELTDSDISLIDGIQEEYRVVDGSWKDYDF